MTEGHFVSAWVLAALVALPAVAEGAAGGEQGLRERAAQRNGAPAPAKAPTQADIDARKKFLEVEKFARLPEADQLKGFAAFYRTAPLGASTSTMLLSSYPADILNRGRGFQGGDYQEAWGKQLKDAAAEMTAEAVADNLGTATWLNIAMNMRSLQVLKSHDAEVKKLVAAELDSRDIKALEHGCRVIGELELTTFTGKLLDIYLPDGPRAQAAYGALMQLSDPQILPRLLADVERDSKSIKRHAGLFRVPLFKKPAEPVLLKLFSSNDAEIRYEAAHAMSECVDPALAKPIAALAKERAVNTRQMAMLMAANLPKEAFASVRDDLLPSLRSTDSMVQDWAMKAFAQQKDLAVAPVIREFLASPPAQPRGGYNVAVMQSLTALTGSQFGYRSLEWGPEKNAAAIEKFDQWVMSQQRVPVELP